MATKFVAKNPRVISCATAEVSVNLGMAGDLLFDYQTLSLFVIGQTSAGLKTLNPVASAPSSPGSLVLSVTNSGAGAIALGQYVEHNTVSSVQRAGATPFGPVSGVALSAAAPGAALTIAIAGYAKVLVGAPGFGPRALLTVDANGDAVAAASLLTPAPPAIQGGESHAYSLIPGVPGQLCDVILCLNGTRPGVFA